MLMRAIGLVGVLGIFITLFLGGDAGAQSAETPGDQSTGSSAPEPAVPQQEATLEGEVGGLTEVGSQLEDAPAQADAAAARTQELDQQTQKLSKDLEAQREAAAASKARFEQRVRAAYKGQDLAGISLVLNSVLGGDAKLDTILNSPAVRMLLKGRESIQRHKESQQTLEDTIRQLDEKKAEYRKAREEKRARAEKLRRREAELTVALDKLGSKKERMETRLSQLKAAEAAGAFTRPPASASSGGGEMRERELEIAAEDIVARPVEPGPYERYVQIYKASAKRYGFANDWYVLAAVGKVESNHGENMGPSSAGAMGPMQFLPSTWKQYGVDGNGDGVANILDPEDAVPSAAAYLNAGGAPEDWYAALYTYNRAGWYVREVLGVAEGYRRLAEDNRVEPYV